LPGAETAPPTSRGDEVSILVKWMTGRITLGTGPHVLGRALDADIILDFPGVSRRHALIAITASRATIEDLGSKNGTFVGDQRVDGPRSLGDGDIIGVGSVKLTVSVIQAPRSTVTEPN
jgi:pSer/pThr/pTyr-binding forkhead associated (FHA) protein